VRDQCPANEQLDAYAAGRLSPGEAEKIRAHLGRCRRCRGLADLLTDDDTLIGSLRDAIGLPDEQSIRRDLQEHVGEGYQVLEALGQGGTGVVFKARDVRLNRLVAIKCPLETSQRRRLVALFDEARMLARITHPNVAAVYALSEDPGFPYMVMEFVDGVPIDRALEGQPLEQKLAVFRQVLRGVAELHRRGIVHRDLKPGNILVDREGTAKVLDMGIAGTSPGVEGRPAGSRAPAGGTPAYMAPEQAQGKAPQPAADVFSLGIVLFELLTGQRPFKGQSPEQLVRSLCEEDPPLPRALNGSVPGRLQAICLSALEKEPDRRYPTARHFLLDLERFLDGEAVVANPTLLQNVLDHGIDRHVADLSRWQQDRLISTREYDYFLNRYNRLRQREEFWVLDSRRISFSQVVLHLGAWACVIAGFLVQFIEGLGPWERTSVPLGILAALMVLGLVTWRRQNRRVGLVFLMAGSLTLPLFLTTLLRALGWRLLADPGDDFWPEVTNVEFLIVALVWLAQNSWLWRRTRTSAFSLLWTLSGVAAATAAFAVMGLKEWEPDEIGLMYLFPGSLLFVLAMLLDVRHHQPYFAAAPYVIGLAILIGGATALALEGPTTEWLGVKRLAEALGVETLLEPRQIYYSFMINGMVYLAFGLLADRSVQSASLRRIATFLFWIAPSHLLVPVVMLAQDRAWAVLPHDWSIPELLLPLAALGFVFASVPKQMKSFFFSGLGYFAAGVLLITDHHFWDVFAWPIALAAAGLTSAVVAWRKPALFDTSPSDDRPLR